MCLVHLIIFLIVDGGRQHALNFLRKIKVRLHAVWFSQKIKADNFLLKK
jgi:hypothetical protein